ncbi:hypothetical protein [Leptospira paudalimensis]|uniref:Uncharacterized protein n=1 Tax=Leptospira paudalimensis TaxID=2950024 RepID=A0ABT3M674_9LEPT|nr:hypothetical protein [Leptospira paudalimensis]MCW7503873.1 hypothetical protein [Leptospira paudalimensis]
MSKQNEPNKTVETEEPKKVLFGFLSDRLNHPYIGTFIFSFLFYNFEDIAKLIIGLGEEFTEDKIDAIEIFVSSFNADSFKFWIPVFIMIIIPNVFHKLGDVIYRLSQRGRDYFISLIDNFSERANLDSKVGFYQRENSILKERIENLTQNSNVILKNLINQVKKYNQGIGDLRPALSNVSLSVGDLVSYNKDKNFIRFLEKGYPLFGEIFLKLSNDLYIVNLQTKLSVENSILKELPKDDKDYYIYNLGSGKFDFDIFKRDDDKNYIGHFTRTKNLLQSPVKFEEARNPITDNELLVLIEKLQYIK